MKLYSSLLALGVFNGNAFMTSAFAPISATSISTSTPTTLLRSTENKPDFEIFPTFETLETIEPGGTVRTYQLPSWATRVQYRLESFGRPMRGEVNLWLGPQRLTHTLRVNNENGVIYPVQTTLKFKKGPPVLKISTSNDPVYPMRVGVHVPPPDRALELEANTERVWEACKEGTEKQLIQGGNVDGSRGAMRIWTIPHDVSSIQLLGWSRDSGKKSFKVEIELIQGPNNIKQSYFLQCGGGSQPYHVVFQTPGEGWTVRIKNKKFVEDGLVQIAVVPYTTNNDDVPAKGLTWK